jgi:YspA, cpYpsA-related SLOG family
MNLVPSHRRILVTGSREWTDKQTIHRALFDHGRWGDTLVSGSCPTGADRIAEDYWRAFGPIERHPAKWSEGKSAGPRRNQEMVDLGADICLAFPLPESRGTRHCMEAANRAGIPVRVYEPAEDEDQ